MKDLAFRQWLDDVVFYHEPNQTIMKGLLKNHYKRKTIENETFLKDVYHSSVTSI